MVTRRHSVGIEPRRVDGQRGHGANRRVSASGGHQEARCQRQRGESRDAVELVNDDVHRRPPLYPRPAAR